MLVLEAKLKGKQNQYNSIDEAIRTALFIRNKALRHWIDHKDVGKNDLQKLCAVLAKEFDFADKLNSMARQASADRAWLAIKRFYDNCKAKKPLKKGFPRFKKRGHSVEYKTSGWQLSNDRKYISFSDGFNIGRLKLVGTRNLSFYSIQQIKRVRILKRADGYYCQFCVDVERTLTHQHNGKQVGIDLGLEFFYTDSDGKIVENPRLLRKSEKSLKRKQRLASKCKKSSSNRAHAVKKLAKKHLKVSRQRKDFAVKTARTLVQSNDLVVYEDLQVKNLVKNHHLAKSISDASWSLFTDWVDYYAKVFDTWVIAVAPHYTSQDCSVCGTRVKKSLSTRTHKCHSCGTVMHRDHNAAIMILNKGLKSTVGRTESKACGQNDLCLSGETPLSKSAE
ncbi:RNA-guided endonuclease InsQ/TnpB family protein [Anabaena azotica]|uniref:IS200/IS605 family element transposase accessory protein TnpB n=1 Tax=Anabaena azotica FACHB-119 TaxID=947527 RepID=A0ABR8CVR1_9NOST|nr:RNA-guided endonuclease TnpB family protein [Anabaena azotica]MBD2499008.1 IS200/IS605 family element transposase accessory protein TnpB [Anabaena azotica FACHB-119]